MIAVPTLRQRVTQISFGAFALTLAVMMAGFILFSIAKRNLAQKEIARDLSRTAGQQVEQLIPSFLLPEQKQGVKSLLERIQKAEDLTRISIISSESQIPEVFSTCKANERAIVVCSSVDEKETAVIAPISEVGKSFGYLFKSRYNTSAWAVNDILQLAAIVAIVFGIVFILIYIFIARVMSQTLPNALDRLVEWIKADLSDKPSNIPALPFAELHSLRMKISEVMSRHNQAREQALIGQFISGIMHDIRTPLHSVVTAMYLVEKYSDDGSKRLLALEELANACRDNIPLIGEIIETTLDGGRQIQIKKIEQDLVSTIKEAVALTEKMQKIRKVKIYLNLPDSLIVSHDRVQLIRVLHNLIKNAIEAASENQGDRSVKISLNIYLRGDLEVLVDDSGTGIVGSTDKLFTAFQSTKVHGTGLGLLVSKKIIEAHNGAIVASNSSTIGGARFAVSLPYRILEVGHE